MAHSHAPKPIQSDFDLGYNHQRDTRRTRRWSPRATRNRFNHTPIDAHRGLKQEGSLAKAWNKFQADWKLREERRQSNGFLPPRLHESDYASTSRLDDPRNRFSHPTSSSQIPVYQDVDFVNIDADRPRVASLSYDRQLYQHYFSYPSPSMAPNRGTQQTKPLQKVCKDNPDPGYHLLPPSSTLTERFAQGRSDSLIQPQEHPNAPIDHPTVGSTSDSSASKLRGLTRRPRVRNSHRRNPRALGDVSTKSVDLGTPQVTKMGYSVMSVRHSNPDGSGSSTSSRFALPPTTARPTPIGRPESGARPLGASPSSHVELETERPVSRIKAREEAGSAPINTYSIPEKDPRTLTTPSLMNHMEDEWHSLSPVSTPKAPPPDQNSVIREDLRQEDERPIAGCRTDPRISFREAAVVQDRNSLDSVHSTSPSLKVSHLESHAASANKSGGRNQSGQQSLFQDLYQMLDPPAHPGSDVSRSKVNMARDEKSGEETICPDTPRGPGGPEQTLHVDVLLAQRTIRDAMREDGEYVEFLFRSCMLSASECGEEAADSDSSWSERGLDRKHSTRSVFDWGYA